MASPSFVLALCQPGAERALVAEAERAGLVRAYSARGLVTLKSAVPLDVEGVVFPSVFARYLGLSVGKAGADAGAVVEAVRSLDADRLHVVALHDDNAEAVARAHALRAAVLAAVPERFRPGLVPKDGERVLTVVLDGDTRWIALHLHGRGTAPWPGGRLDVALPDDAPSRAWLKLEEAVHLFDLPLAAGQHAVELGSAPGGAVRNLLGRGLTVTGIDPNAMDADILAHAGFRHIRKVSTSVDPASLGAVDWLLLDVNVPPGTALRGALPFVEANARTLKGIVFTLKMKDWTLAREVPGWLGRIQRAAPQLKLAARQLSSNGQEICVVGVVGVARVTATED